MRIDADGLLLCSLTDVPEPGVASEFCLLIQVHVDLFIGKIRLPPCPLSGCRRWAGPAGAWQLSLPTAAHFSSSLRCTSICPCEEAGQGDRAECPGPGERGC